MTAETRIRVLTVDDHAIVRVGLRALIDQQPEFLLVGEANDAVSARAEIGRLHPELVVMDVRLGAADGIELTRDLLATWPSLRVLILSAYAGDEEVYRAIEAGARAYLLKEFAGSELVAALDHVRRGLRYVSPDVARRLTLHGARVSLTPRELDVLNAVSLGYRNAEIAAKLGISGSTARTHVERLMAKFDCHDRTRLVAIALARGFLASERISAQIGDDR